MKNPGQVVEEKEKVGVRAENRIIRNFMVDLHKGRETGASETKSQIALQQVHFLASKQ